MELEHDDYSFTAVSVFDDKIGTIRKMFPNLPESELDDIQSDFLSDYTLRLILVKSLTEGNGMDAVYEDNDIFMYAKRRALEIEGTDENAEPIPPPDPLTQVIETKPLTVQSGKGSGRGRKVDPNSPAQRTIVMYAQATDKSRDTLVALFVEQFKVSEATAKVYYYKARQEFEKNNS